MKARNPLRTNLIICLAFLVAIGGIYTYTYDRMMDIYVAAVEGDETTSGEYEKAMGQIVQMAIKGHQWAAIVTIIGGIAVKLADEKPPPEPSVPLDAHMALINGLMGTTLPPDAMAQLTKSLTEIKEHEDSTH